jgi:hypothetical protein
MTFAVGMAAGFGAGFGAGMGSGIATGIASGEKRARDEIERKLRDLSENFDITVRDRRGRPVPFEDLATEILEKKEVPDKKTGLVVAVVIGALLVACLAFFLIAL